MSTYFTRAAFRDIIRRNIQIPPPLDTNQGAEGDCPSAFPSPSNADLNQAINEAIANLNIACDLGRVLDVEVSVAAQTANGPFYIDLRTVTAPGRDANGWINTVERASWTTDDTNFTRLFPVSRREKDRNGRMWENDAPGTPNEYWIEGYNLALWTAPGTAGTLHLIAGTELFPLSTDGATLTEIAAQFQVVVSNYATMLVAVKRPQDAEMQAIAGNFGAMAKDGMQALKVWANRKNVPQQGAFGCESYRRHDRGRRR